MSAAFNYFFVLNWSLITLRSQYLCIPAFLKNTENRVVGKFAIKNSFTNKKQLCLRSFSKTFN